MKTRARVLLTVISVVTVLCVAFLPIARALTLYENNTAGGSGYIQLVTFYAAQNFTVGSVDHTINQLEMYLKQSGTPVDTVTVGLRNVGPSGQPTGGNLISFSFNASIITTSYVWYNFTFSTPYTVTAGSRFCFVAHETGGTAGKEVQWSYATGNPYTFGNAFYSYDGGSWTAMSTADLSFKVWGDVVHPSYNNTGQNSTETATTTLLYSCWTQGNATMQLDGYILSWNDTGAFQNDTWVAFSSPTSAWANITHTITATGGQVVQWFLIVNCTDGNIYSDMTRQNFTVTMIVVILFSGGGIVQINGTAIQNNTSLTYSISVVIVRIEGLPENASFVLSNSSWTYGTADVNRYNLTVRNNQTTTIWTYFGTAAGGTTDRTRPEDLAALIVGGFIGVLILIAAIVIWGRRH